jgi:trk system potassium uptake protein TrkH
MFALALGTLLISLEKGIDLTASLTSVASCLANVGPYFGFGKFSGNFANFSYPSKLLLSVFMLMGRLELYPVVILLYPSTWKKKGQF